MDLHVRQALNIKPPKQKLLYLGSCAFFPKLSATKQKLFLAKSKQTVNDEHSL